MSISQQKISELNQKLKLLSLSNFEEFCSIANLTVTKAAIYFYWKEGKSERTIARIVGMSKSGVHGIIQKFQRK